MFGGLECGEVQANVCTEWGQVEVTIAKGEARKAGRGQIVKSHAVRLRNLNLP